MLFLSSGLLYGEDLDTRLAILQRIKDKEGIITYEDLVEIGVYADGESKSWGQEYADLLEYGYQKNCEGTSLDELDRQYRAQQQMQMTMMVAMAAAPLIDWAFNGSSGITLDPKRRLEGIELEGWNIKGPPSYIDAPEVAKKPDEPAAGTEAIISRETLPNPTFAAEKLQHEYKHAGDFGVNGNWNKAAGEAYQSAIQNHFAASTDIFRSTYRGQEVYVYINRNSGIGAYTDLSGGYIGGWKFSPEQIEFHFANGVRIN